ncbi:MAG: holo-ACP synthase [Candidatus Pelagibacter sp.]
MNILGNGVDIVKNSRIKKAIENDNFIKRIYSNSEIKESKKIFNKTNFFAKRFAAKEAFVKSLGTGFRNGINFNDISIKKKISGKPIIFVNNKLKQLIKKKFKINKFQIFLSLSDEDKYSIAYVIIKKTK